MMTAQDMRDAEVEGRRVAPETPTAVPAVPAVAPSAKALRRQHGFIADGEARKAAQWELDRLEKLLAESWFLLTI